MQGMTSLEVPYSISQARKESCLTLGNPKVSVLICSEIGNADFDT